MKRNALRAGTVERARKLRRNATDAEKRLWSALREKLPEAKFRRQVPLGPYIADFASHRHKLIVEVDGGQHGEPANAAKDMARTGFLEGEGYRVLRVWNNDVLGNSEGVIEQIAASLAVPMEEANS
ncbi:MAG: endonuclease domain-containing protein [Parasphingopyxis sp.]|uniref:endonuclease domain-containing protein n=1 Tax=Parasphingopyxis sp. TaxID=1920299 RepID=UPI0032EB167C